MFGDRYTFAYVVLDRLKLPNACSERGKSPKEMDTTTEKLSLRQKRCWRKGKKSGMQTSKDPLPVRCHHPRLHNHECLSLWVCCIYDTSFLRLLLLLLPTWNKTI